MEKLCFNEIILRPQNNKQIQYLPHLGFPPTFFSRDVQLDNEHDRLFVQMPKQQHNIGQNSVTDQEGVAGVSCGQ